MNKFVLLLYLYVQFFSELLNYLRRLSTDCHSSETFDPRLPFLCVQMSWIDSNKTLYSNITTFNKKYYWDCNIATYNVWTAGGGCVTYVPDTICLNKWSTVALQRCHRLQIVMSRCEGTCLFGISSFLCFSVKMKYRNVHAYSTNVEQISRYKWKLLISNGRTLLHGCIQ